MEGVRGGGRGTGGRAGEQAMGVGTWQTGAGSCYWEGGPEGEQVVGPVGVSSADSAQKLQLQTLPLPSKSYHSPA